MNLTEPGFLTEQEIQELENTASQWNLVQLNQFTRELNKVLKQPDIQRLYDYAARGFQALRRWQVLQMPHFNHLPGARKPKDGELLKPYEVDSCDWRWDLGPGRRPLFHDYCCHSACHWMSLANLEVAKRLFPEIDWVILSSQYHTTVAAPEHKLLFDLYYFANSVSPEEAVGLLVKPSDDEEACVEMYNDEYPYSFEELAVTGKAIEFWNMIDALDKTDEEKLRIIKEAKKLGTKVITQKTTVATGATTSVAKTIQELKTYED